MKPSKNPFPETVFRPCGLHTYNLTLTTQPTQLTTSNNTPCHNLGTHQFLLVRRHHKKLPTCQRLWLYLGRLTGIFSAFSRRRHNVACWNVERAVVFGETFLYLNWGVIFRFRFIIMMIRNNLFQHLFLGPLRNNKTCFFGCFLFNCPPNQSFCFTKNSAPRGYRTVWCSSWSPDFFKGSSTMELHDSGTNRIVTW